MQEISSILLIISLCTLFIFIIMYFNIEFIYINIILILNKWFFNIIRLFQFKVIDSLYRDLFHLYRLLYSICIYFTFFIKYVK